MNTYSGAEIIRMLEGCGWRRLGSNGQHYLLEHPIRKSKLTITLSEENVPHQTVKKIEQYANVMFD